MSEEILANCDKKDKNILEITRAKEQREASKEIYRSATNVVGKDIKAASLDTQQIHNSGNENFVGEIANYFNKLLLS